MKCIIHKINPVKNIKLCSFLVLKFSSTPHFAQEEITEVERIEASSKVWGFLKYYHPKVSKGKFDWYQQLIEKIPISS